MRWTGIALALGLALVVTTGAEAAPKKHKPKPTVKKAKAWTGAENSLIGIKLYDSGQKVIEMYGTPDEVQALSFNGVTSGGSSGAGGGSGPMGPRGGPPSGFPGGRGGGMPGAAPGPRGGKDGDVMTDDTSFDDNDVLFLQGKMRPGGGGAGRPMMGPSGAGGGMGPGGPGGTMGPRGAGGPGLPGGGGGAGVPGTNGGVQDRVTFTRWVYNRDGSKYAFIIDKMGHVMQIEAIGIDNSKVKTKRGIGLGSTFKSIYETYAQPDGYEIGGDNLMLKYLVHDNVAFRLTRLGTKKPQVVTGIVVAAGKS